MIKDITLGQYFPGRSFLHRMDARIKMILTFLFIIFLFIANNFVAVGLMVVAVVACVALSRVPVKLYFKGLKAILFIVIFTSLLNIFYVTDGRVLVHWKFITITDQGILRSVYVSLRIACMIVLSCALTYTTSPTDLTDAIERLMRPLRVIKVPVHEIAMMMTIALRFVPTLLEETDKIMSAQKARGADMESGGLISRMKAMIPILIPLFVSSFRSAYDLSIAKECRCYHGGEGRTRMKQLKLRASDFVALGTGVLLCIGVILCNILLKTTI